MGQWVEFDSAQGVRPPLAVGDTVARRSPVGEGVADADVEATVSAEPYELPGDPRAAKHDPARPRGCWVVPIVYDSPAGRVESELHLDYGVTNWKLG